MLMLSPLSSIYNDLSLRFLWEDSLTFRDGYEQLITRFERKRFVFRDISWYIDPVPDVRLLKQANNFRYVFLELKCS